MSASVSGSKTVNSTLAPHLTAAELTALLAIAPENMTVAQLGQLNDAISRVADQGPAATVGQLLK